MTLVVVTLMAAGLLLGTIADRVDASPTVVAIVTLGPWVVAAVWAAVA